MTPPRAQDVTCGRGKNRWNSAGNVRFKELIASNLDRYRNAPSKGQKSTIVKEIYDVLRGSGARFLKLDEQGSDRWVELGLMQGKTKIAHALRDLSRIRRERGGANGGGVRSACSTNSLEEDENESSCSSSQPTLLTTRSIRQGLHQEEDHNNDNEEDDHAAAPGVLLSTRKRTASSSAFGPLATGLCDEHCQKEEGHGHRHQHVLSAPPSTPREALALPSVTKRRRNLLQDNQQCSVEHPLLHEVAANRQLIGRGAVDTVGITSDADWYVEDEEQQGFASLQDDSNEPPTDKHYPQMVDKLNAPYIGPRQEPSEESTQEGFMKIPLFTNNNVLSSRAETSTLASLREGLNIMNFPFSPAFDLRRELHDQPPFSYSYLLPPSSHSYEQPHQWPGGQRFVAPFIEAPDASSTLPRPFFACPGVSAGAVSTHASVGGGTSNSIIFSVGGDLLRVGLLGAADSHAAGRGLYAGAAAEPQFAYMAADALSPFPQPAPSSLSNNQNNHHMFLTLPPQEQQEQLRLLSPNYSNSHLPPFAAGWGSAQNLYERPFSPLSLFQPATPGASFAEQGLSEASGVRSEEEVLVGHPQHHDQSGESFPSNATHFSSR